MEHPGLCGLGGGEGGFGGGEGGADFFFAVGGAEEGGFKLRGGQPDASLEHGAVEGGELPGVGAGGAVVIRDRVAGEKPGKHGADAVGGDGNSAACARAATPSATAVETFSNCG